MARLFDDASSHRLTRLESLITVHPYSVSVWFNSDDDTTQQTVFSETNVTTAATRIYIRGDIAGNPIRFDQEGGTGNHALDSQTGGGVGYTTNTWHNVVISAASTTSCIMYLDGVSVSTDTDSSTIPVNTQMDVGRDAGASIPSAYFSGKIAEFATWTVALSAAEAASLSKGVSPRLVRPTSLQAYWNLLGNDSPEVDYLHGFGLTVSGATKATDHPRVFQPTSRTQIGQSTLFTKALAGAIASAGALSKSLARSLTGTISSAAALVVSHLYFASLSGTITSAGSLTRRAGKALAGSIASAGALTVSFFIGSLMSAVAIFKTRPRTSKPL